MNILFVSGAFFACFIAAAGLAGFVSLFGAKELSFEEALEEQKKRREREREEHKAKKLGLKEAKKANKKLQAVERKSAGAPAVQEIAPQEVRRNGTLPIITWDINLVSSCFKDLCS